MTSAAMMSPMDDDLNEFIPEDLAFVPMNDDEAGVTESSIVQASDATESSNVVEDAKETQTLEGPPWGLIIGTSVGGGILLVTVLVVVVLHMKNKKKIVLTTTNI